MCHSGLDAPYVLPVLLHGCMIPEENLNLPVFRNCTWSWHHLNREVGAATPWIRGPLAHAVRDAHFAHLPPVPILGAVHARDLDYGRAFCCWTGHIWTIEGFRKTVRMVLSLSEGSLGASYMQVPRACRCVFPLLARTDRVRQTCRCVA